MPDTTILPKPLFTPPGATACELQTIVAKVLEEVWAGMKWPSDPHDKMVAVNTINNVFDRIEDAVHKRIAETRTVARG